MNFFGEKKADDILQIDIENLILQRSEQISQKTGKPITRDTINLELIALKTIFRRLVAEGVLTESSARRQAARRKRP